jgi:hypothetical protein
MPTFVAEADAPSRTAAGDGLLFCGGTFAFGAVVYALLAIAVKDETAFHRDQLLLSRAIALVLAAYTVVFLVRHAREFLLRRDLAVNLAAFRICYFGPLVLAGLVYPDGMSRMVGPWLDLPIGARVPIDLWGSWTYAVPVTRFWVGVCTAGMLAGAWGGLLGLFTRASLMVFYLSAFYLYLVPNLFGKINHTHDLLWIAAVLACSPCADVLSIDSVLKRRLRRSPDRLEEPAVRYGFPLALTWLMVGTIYFFPGFWKLWDSGLSWAFSDQLRFLLYEKWAQLGGWQPFVRIDRHPALLTAAALGVLAFECSFLVLVARDATRKLAIAGGVAVHVAIALFMHIFFVLVLLAYVSFVNWAGILARLRGTVDAAMSTWTPGRDPSTVPGAGRPGVGITVVAVVLVAGNVLCGAMKLNSWPFACYPTFSWQPARSKEAIHFSVRRADGRVEPLDASLLRDLILPQRLQALEDGLARADASRADEIARALQSLWDKAGVRFASGDQLQFFAATESVDPDATSPPAAWRHVKTLTF